MGPVLFKQERLGQYGKPFTVLKFRSMRTDSDPKIHQQYVEQFIAGQVDGNSTQVDEASLQDSEGSACHIDRQIHP